MPRDERERERGRRATAANSAGTVITNIVVTMDGAWLSGEENAWRPGTEYVFVDRGNLVFSTAGADAVVRVVGAAVLAEADGSGTSGAGVVGGRVGGRPVLGVGTGVTGEGGTAVEGGAGGDGAGGGGDGDGAGGAGGGGDGDGAGGAGGAGGGGDGDGAGGGGDGDGEGQCGGGVGLGQPGWCVGGPLSGRCSEDTRSPTVPSNLGSSSWRHIRSGTPARPFPGSASTALPDAPTRKKQSRKVPAVTPAGRVAHQAVRRLLGRREESHPLTPRIVRLSGRW